MSERDKSKSNEKAEKSRFIKKANIWLNILIAAIVLLAGFTFLNSWAIFKCDPEIEIKGDSTYINVIIAITGFLAAFSAISIYSIFNTNVDREKDRLETLRSDVEKLKEDLKGQIKKKTQALDKKLNDQNDHNRTSERELNEYLNLVKSINNLTSPYSIELKKIETIKYFSTIPYVSDDIKDLIYNFYISLESNEEEKSKKYYKELREMLIGWGKIIE